MIDEIRQTIDRYLDRAADDGDDEIDDVLAEYTSQHASERMDRQRGTTRRRRGTSLTILSGDVALAEVASTLSSDERLVLADDGYSVEIVQVDEDDEEPEGVITVLRG